jgi:hypothetical protein
MSLQTLAAGMIGRQYAGRYIPNLSGGAPPGEASTENPCRRRFGWSLPRGWQKPLLLLAAAAILACSAEEKASAPPAAEPGGFTFFSVGADTVFSDRLRERLQERLGDDAIERRSTIDLEVNGPGFLQRHFAWLDDLNRRLNHPPGERVDHNTVKLMYRYATRKDLPFSYVEILFSNYTSKPLYIYIRSGRDLSGIVETLKQKHGPPLQIEEAGEGIDAQYWSEQSDLLLVTTHTTRRGDREYRVMICYGANLEALIATEEADRRAKEEERRRAGQRAF